MPDYDVIVCGGGPAGVTAALAAARNGAHTLLIERYGFVGGSSTAALVYPWMTFHTARGEQVIGGIAQELVDRLIERGASPGHLRDTIGFVHTLTPFDPEAYKALADELLAAAGVELLYHTQITGVAVDGTQIEGLRLWNKSGAHSLTARIYIDSTGDGDIAAAAGVPFVLGRRADGRTQPMTMNFVMGGVDLEAVIAYMRAHPEDFHAGSLIDELDRLPLTGVSGFFSAWQRHAPPNVPRDRVLFFVGLRPDEVRVNTSRILDRDGTNAWDLAAAEREGRQQVRALVEFCRAHLPGFAQSYLSHTPTQVGVRETRHIHGRYTLTGADVVAARRFPDAIARSGYPIDIHDPGGAALESRDIAGGDAYDIPFRCLLPVGIDNLLLNGRCISTTHTAFSSARLTPSCMAIGQAAGTAAALALRRRCPPTALAIEELQAHLRRQGALL